MPIFVLWLWIARFNMELLCNNKYLAKGFYIFFIDYGQCNLYNHFIQKIFK